MAIKSAARAINNALKSANDFLFPGIKTGALAGHIAEYLMKLNVDDGFIVHISPEEIVCHGNPDNRVLEEGQIVTLDTACSVNGWWADMAVTLPVGKIDRKRKRLIEASIEGTLCMARYSKEKFNGEGSSRLNWIGEKYNVNLVSEANGHRLGRLLHEDPIIPYTGEIHEPLQSGCVYSVEPIFTAGMPEVSIHADGQVVTKDFQPSAHFELCVLAGPQGGMVLESLDWFDPYIAMLTKIGFNL